MEMFWEGVLTFLAVLGLVMLIWVLFGRILCPVPGKGMYILLIGTGCGEGLEGKLRGVIWLRSLGLLNCPVVVADVGLNRDGKELAERLTRQWSKVYQCSAEELGKVLSCSFRK